MKHLITFFILCLLVQSCESTSTSTSDPQALDGKEEVFNENIRESVEELLGLMKAESMINQIYSQMGQMMRSVGQQLEVNTSEQEMFDKYVSETTSLMKAEMNWDKIKEPMIEIYLKHYSEKEIQDTLAFYKSDSGQSLIQKMPEVTKDSRILSQELVKHFMPKLQEMSQKFKEELAAFRQNQ